MSVIHQPKEPDVGLRLLLFPVVGAALLLVLLLRLWYIQVVKAESLVERAAASREAEQPKLAPRGLMFDRNGVLVAGIRPEVVVTAKPAEVARSPWVLEKVAKLLNVEVARLKTKVADGAWRPWLGTPIYVGAPIEVGIRIAESAADLPGIGVESQPMRYYPDSTSYTHVVGSVRVPNEADVERIRGEGLEPAAYVGRDGIERAFEAAVMGVAGREKVEIDVRRRPLRTVGRDNAVPGDELILSLDGRLQAIATRMMAGKGRRGAVVALDPRNGEVLCLVSSPTFNQELFLGGISNRDWQMLQNDPAKPMLNRAIYSSYSPGSTFKIVTALAAAQSGHFDPNAPIVCTGGYRLGTRFAKCLGRHGAITFQAAMEKSCNTYFYTLGMRSTEKALWQAALDAGLGQTTGIGIPGEGKGIVPDGEWIRAHRNPPVWRGGDTLNMAIGQGELRCTPLQMANVVAMVANRGTIYRPRLVRAIRHQEDGSLEETPTVVAHEVHAPELFWSQVHDSLVRVISNGTAKVAQIPGVRWGGKTGSTEHRRGSLTHGWFVGFAPAEKPKIAIAVLVEAAGHGGVVAAPIARDIVRAYLEERTDSATPASSVSASRASVRRSGSFSEE